MKDARSSAKRWRSAAHVSSTPRAIDAPGLRATAPRSRTLGAAASCMPSPSHRRRRSTTSSPCAEASLRARCRSSRRMNVSHDTRVTSRYPRSWWPERATSRCSSGWYHIFMSDTDPARARRSSRLAVLALIAVLLAAGLALLSWLDTRQRIGATQEELARRLRDIESDARDARAAARQAQETTREAQVRLGQLDARLAEWQSQQLALEALYQDLSRNRDEWQLAEIEQVLPSLRSSCSSPAMYARRCSPCSSPRGAWHAPTARSSRRSAGRSRATSKG